MEVPSVVSILALHHSSSRCYEEKKEPALGRVTSMDDAVVLEVWDKDAAKDEFMGQLRLGTVQELLSKPVPEALPVPVAVPELPVAEEAEPEPEPKPMHPCLVNMHQAREWTSEPPRQERTRIQMQMKQ